MLKWKATLALFVVVVFSTSSTAISSGHEVQIVDVSKVVNASFVLNEDELAKILTGKCKQLPVSVISIAGDYRKGKSFLLNFFVRYFQTNGAARGDKWLSQGPDSPLTGFTWKGGSQSQTTGILMWSEPFVVKTKTTRGVQDVCVILMDTQGTFDHKQSMKSTTQIFAMSTMVSSKQIYNQMYNLQENDFQNLDMFSDYGRYAMNQTSQTPFQDLVFLVRDWPYDYEHPYGFQGGQDYIDNKLKTTDVDSELARVRRNIRTYFKSVSCFLMPHPGNQVSKKDFIGKPSTLSTEFLEQVEKFVTKLVSPENLVMKTIAGSEVTGRSLFEYFRTYFNVFQSSSMPNPMSILEATAEAANRAAAMSAKDYYHGKIQEFIEKMNRTISPQQLEEAHEKYFPEALKIFDTAPKMGDKMKSDQYRQDVTQFVKESFGKLKTQIFKRYQELVEAEHKVAMANAISHYVTEMRRLVTKERLIESEMFDQLDLQCRKRALDVYDKYVRTSKVGKDEDHKKYQVLLTQQLDVEYRQWRDSNERALFQEEKERVEKGMTRAAIGEMGEENCCPLVWKETRDLGFIPSDAIKIGQISGESRYFTYLPGSSRAWPYRNLDMIGVKTNNPNLGSAFVIKIPGKFHDPYEFKSEGMRYRKVINGKTHTRETFYDYKDTPYRILTNPYNCAINWWMRQYKNQMPSNTRGHHFPKVGVQYFARRHRDNNRNSECCWGGTMGDVDRDTDYYEGDDFVYRYETGPGPEAMYIDCQESITRGLLKYQMIDLKIDEANLDLTGEATLDKAVIENGSNISQTSKLILQAETRHSLEMKTETECTKWAQFEIKETIGIDLTKYFVNLGFEFTQSWGWTDLQREGKVTVTEQKRSFNFEQELKVNPRTKVTASVLAIPVNGRIPFTATYRITKRYRTIETLTRFRIKAALNKLGFSDASRLQENKDGSYNLTYYGWLNLHSSSNVRVKIQEEPLDGMDRTSLLEKVFLL